MIQTLAFHFNPKKDLFILDQTLLPEQKIFLKIESPQDMAKAIINLKVRGANLIGITAALSLANYAFKKPFPKDFKQQAELLKMARPTAIHLSKAVDLVLRQKSPQEKLNQAIAFYKEDQLACSKIALIARPLVNSGDNLLTYCNTGSLATGGIGTALGVIKQASKDKKNIHVYVCETRPVNQGSRLTFWELQEEKIPSTLICDNMIASLMSKNKIQKVFVGADRISRNGDTANKIGTFNLALISHHFKVPFYVVAPSSTIDTHLETGEDIPIEQREASEVSAYWANKSSIWNPSFDITSKDFITGIITETACLNPKHL